MDHLRTSIAESIAGQRTPKLGSAGERTWARILRKLREDGQRAFVPARPGAFDSGWGWREIVDVIAWLPSHERGEFKWGKVVLSPAALRKHFPRLLDEMRADRRTAKKHAYAPPPEAPPDPELDARRAALRRLRERAGDPHAQISVFEIEEELRRTPPP